MQIQEMSSPQRSNADRLFWYSLHLSRAEFFIPEQILEYEDYKNGTESEYEEYEIYEDSFDFAERDRAETWNGEVSLKVNSVHEIHQVSGHILNCLCQVISNNPYLFICFSSSG